MFHLCQESNCNRKYKTKAKLIFHYSKDHQKVITEDLIPEPIQIPAKPKKSKEEKQKLKEDKQRIISENKELYSIPDKPLEKECSICSDRESNAVVIPCGHALFCLECILHYQTNFGHRGCPSCRGKIEKVIQIFQ